MLYLSDDLHRKHMTVNLRDEAGEVLLRRQVSTWGDEPQKFLADVQRRAGSDGWVVILEVCGFHDWLLELLPQYGCREIVLVQPEKKSSRKTDRRDANQLGELLWVNRARLLAGRKVQGLRRVVPPKRAERDDRRLTQLRFNVTADLTRTINRVKYILRRLNIEQHCPTKGMQTQKAKAWLKTLSLPSLDRLEMDQLLSRWTALSQQRDQLDRRIVEQAALDPRVPLLRTTPGASHYTALALSCRIGDIGRFPTPRALGNYWGLTPSCDSSGPNERLGSITKEGSTLARYLLGQLVLHVLRKDGAMREWFRRIKEAARREDRARRRHAAPDRDLLAHAHEAATVQNCGVDGRSQAAASPRPAERLGLSLTARFAGIRTMVCRPTKRADDMHRPLCANLAQAGRSGCSSAEPYPPAWLPSACRRAVAAPS